ncbi:MAG: hypothetical protein ABIK65_04370 [Candidatus Eisenbacteria bacterium]
MKPMKRLMLIALVLGGVLVGAYQLQAGDKQSCAPGSECCPEQCDPADCGTSCN